MVNRRGKKKKRKNACLLALERSVPRGTEHVHAALRLNLLSGAVLGTAGRAMKKGGKRSRGEMGVIISVWS